MRLFRTPAERALDRALAERRANRAAYRTAQLSNFADREAARCRAARLKFMGIV